MKFRDKYKALSSQEAVKNRIIVSVFATMMLEGQGVSKDTLAKLYEQTSTPKAEVVA
jgi:hypothetical protein